MAHQLISSLNAGELSPYLDARSDLEKYTSGCRQLENFILLPYGGAYRRPGTEYLGRAKFADKPCRLIGFNYSANTRFVLELGDQYMRFWQNGARLRVGELDAWETSHAYVPGNFVTFGEAPYYCLIAHTSGDWQTALDAGYWAQQDMLEVVTPYDFGELQDIQYVQINDVMYLVHEKYPPQKLTRVEDTKWTFAEVKWDYPTLLDENIEEFKLKADDKTGSTTVKAVGRAWVTAKPYTKGEYISDSGNLYQALASYTTSATVADDLTAKNLKFAPAVFQEKHVGAYFGIAHLRDSSFLNRKLSTDEDHDADTDIPTLDVLGDWELTTYGIWKGTLKLQRSYDNGVNWETIRTWINQSKGERNVSSKGNQEKRALLRLFWDSAGAGADSPNARLEIADNKIYGVVRVTAYVDDYTVEADVINDLLFAGSDEGAATKYWAEGAWSEVRGYPRVVALHQQRMWYGSTTYRPQSLWSSKVDDFENMMLNSNDDSGLFFSFAATEANAIQWIVAQAELLIGTEGDEWTLGSGDQNNAITPTNVKVLRQSSYGSKYLRAVLVNDVILFVQRRGRKVRELVYSFEKSGWVATDLTVLAEHVTKGQIMECAFQQQPDAIYWTVTGEGQLVGMTYERAQNVVGWHRHTTDGNFESVATIYGSDGGDDEVWVSVQRTIGHNSVRYIERMNVDYRRTFQEEDKPNWWYLDCARRTVGSSAAGTVSGLAHLEGRQINLWADGAVAPSRTVNGGAVALQDPAKIILAGLPYTSLLKPMRLEMQLQDGASRGRMKRIHRMIVSLLKSMGGEFSSDGVTWDWLYPRAMYDRMDQSPPVFTGDKQVYVAGNHSPSADISLRQTQPMPLTILALVVDLDVYGD